MTIYNSGSTLTSDYQQWVRKNRAAVADVNQFTPHQNRVLDRIIKAQVMRRRAYMINTYTHRALLDKLQRMGWMDTDGYPTGELLTHIDAIKCETQ